MMLAKYCVAYYEPAGTTLVREGDTERRVRIRKDEGFGGSQVIAQLGEGHAFGEMALFDAEPRSATVEAETDTTLVRLSTEDFDRLIREVPELGIKLITKIASLMSQRLRQTSGRLVEALADD
jgi:CRP-like cAMP-binding protein